MSEVQIPFPLKNIPLKPEMTGKLKLDETMVQTIAALCGWDGEARHLLRSTLAGDLYIASPSACCVINKYTEGAVHTITFGSIPTTEVMVMANYQNGGDVWVNIDTAAAVDSGWLLDAGDYVQFSIDNMSRLKLYTATIGDKVIILRTV